MSSRTLAVERGNVLRGRHGRVAGVARKAVCIPLSLALVACCTPVPAYAASQNGGSLQASPIAAQDVGSPSPGDNHSSLYSAYLPVLFRAANGMGEFADSYRMCDPSQWAPRYFLFDLGGDGIPELFVRANSFSGTALVHVFTVVSGEAAQMGSYWEWMGSSAGNNAGELFVAGWNQGSSYVNAITAEGDKVVSTFLKAGRATAASPDGEMKVVNDYLNARNAKWLASSDIADYAQLEKRAWYSLSRGSLTVAAAGVYTGIAKTPKVTARFGKTALQPGIDYRVSYQNNVNAGVATAVIEGMGDYRGSLRARFSIGKADIAKAKTTVASGGAYTGAAKKPAVTVRSESVKLKEGADYSVAYANNKNAGTATATVTGKGNFQGSKKVSFAIAKAVNPLSVKAVSKTLAASAVSKKAQSFKFVSILKKGQGKTSFKNASTAAVKKLFSVNGSSGAVTAKKGAKKGSYAVKVTVAAAGNGNYKALSKTVTAKVVIR